MPDTAAVALKLLSAALLPLLLEWLMNFEPFYLCRNTDYTALTAFLQYAATEHSMSWGRALRNIIITPLHDFMNLLRFNNATLTLARSTVTASPRHCHYCGHGGVPSPDFQSTATKERTSLSLSASHKDSLRIRIFPVYLVRL